MLILTGIGEEEGGLVADAIARRSLLFETAYNAGDARRLVADYFVSDAAEPCASPPGGTLPVRGREALVAMFDAMIPSAPGITLITVQLIASASVAYELGRAVLRLADGGSAFGRYTVCWVKEGDDWRARVDFFAQDGWDEADGQQRG